MRKISVFLSFALVLTLVTACGARPNPTPTVTSLPPTMTSAPPTTTPANIADTDFITQLKNFKYCELWGECVSLKDGKGVLGDVSYSLLGLYAIGDLNGDGLKDAAVLIQAAGFTTIEYLIVVLDQNGKLSEDGGEPLAAKTQLRALRIEDDQIILDADVSIEADNSDFSLSHVTWTYVLPGIPSKILDLARMTSTSASGISRGLIIESPAENATVSGQVTVQGKFTAAPSDRELVSLVYSNQEVPVIVSGPGEFNLPVNLSFAAPGPLRIEIRDSYTANGYNEILAADSILVNYQPVGASLAPTLPFGNIKMIDEQDGWAWSDDNHLFSTTDGGLTWRELSEGQNFTTFGAFFLDANIAWLVGFPDQNNLARIYRTTDGGRTWEQFPAPGAVDLTLNFYNAKLGWGIQGIGGAGNFFFSIFQTKDGGETWTQLIGTNPPDGKNLGPNFGIPSGGTVSFSPPETIWITLPPEQPTFYASLIVSWDNGKSWEQINPALPAADVPSQSPVYSEAPQFVSEKDAYFPVALVDKLRFFASHDGGKTWTLLPSVLPSAGPDPWVQFVSLQDGFANCADKLCVTHDGARTWQAFSTGFSLSTQSGSYASQTDFVNASTGWAILQDAYDHTSLVKTSDSGQTWTTINPQIK